MCLGAEHERMKRKDQKKQKKRMSCEIKRDIVYQVVSTTCILTNIIEIIWKYSSNHPHYECRVSLKMSIIKTPSNCGFYSTICQCLIEQIAPHFLLKTFLVLLKKKKQKKNPSSRIHNGFRISWNPPTSQVDIYYGLGRWTDVKSPM